MKHQNSFHSLQPSQLYQPNQFVNLAVCLTSRLSILVQFNSAQVRTVSIFSYSVRNSCSLTVPQMEGNFQSVESIHCYTKATTEVL